MMRLNEPEDGIPLSRTFSEAFVNTFVASRHYRNRLPFSIAIRIPATVDVNSVLNVWDQLASEMRAEVSEFFVTEANVQGILTVRSETTGRSHSWTGLARIEHITTQAWRLFLRKSSRAMKMSTFMISSLNS